MKILHTSDWHLGQTFFTKTRKDEHEAFLQWLLSVAEQEQVDLIIVAGDIFDTGTPPSYARQLYNQFVVDLQHAGCELVVLGGNHDAVSVLNESRQLLSCLNTHVIASTGISLQEQVLTINNRRSEPGAIICAVPFIRPRDVLQSQAGDTGTDKRRALGEAIAAHYDTVYQHALEIRQHLGKPLPIIATGHLTALGVSQSDSVRDIYIGTLEGFAAEGFPPADYIALGHIHRPQKVAKSESIRYSGSPIPLSFDELKHRKQIILVEFAGDAAAHINPIDVPIFQPMACHSGSLEELASELASYEQTEQTVWLSLEVTTQGYLSDLQQRIATMTDGLNVEVLQLRRARNRQADTLRTQTTETLSELSPKQVFARRLALEEFDDTAAGQLRKQRLEQQFDVICEAIRHPQDDAQ
ncbi:exonuclease subunit SbcD [Salinimonas chungwhensis]|uniref:exonuclease subunit SbcD n=1 Tax=Salinimonas chungwhensis TaxID=265425 RepID=UPI00036FA1C9|nr:exonuclease subunit SbcD [Salinimonas chungwhensis]